MSFSLPGSNGQDGTSDKDTITVSVVPVFVESTNLTFTGGSSVEQFLKPEERKLAVVSTPHTSYLSEAWGPWGLDETWRRFLVELEHLLEKQNPVELNGCSSNFSSGTMPKECRVVICSPAPLSAQLFKRKRERDDNEEDEEVVTLPMKLKVISNMSLNLSKAEREQSCLTRLVRLCGPQNVSWVMEGLGTGNKYPCYEPLIKLVWNEDDLAFEGKVPLTFRKVDMRTFGRSSGMIETAVKLLGFRLTYAGVNQVLREIYGRAGQDWRLKQEILEEESFADLAIVSENAKDQGTIKCHKVHLAGASRVFANMLKESATWEEAKTGTITLPESEDAIRAMVHFIYYGGTDRIFGNRMDVVVELLEAGHKYDLKNLVEVTSFVLLAIVDENEKDKWFSVDAAVELFCFASLHQGKMWSQLNERSGHVLRLKTKEERMASEGFQRIYQIALKIGPVFVAALDHLDELILPGKEGEHQLPAPIANVTQEEAKLFYDLWFSICRNCPRPRNVEILLGMTMLAEYCGRAPPELGDIEMLQRLLIMYDLDFLHSLYNILKRRNDRLWRELNHSIIKAILFSGSG